MRKQQRNKNKQQQQYLFAKVASNQKGKLAHQSWPHLRIYRS